MFAVVYYYCDKQEKRGTHQRAFFPPFFPAKVSRMSKSWGRRAGRRKRIYGQSRLGSLVSSVTVHWWEHCCFLSCHVRTLYPPYIFIEEAYFPSPPLYVISSHKRCYSQKHTQTVILCSHSCSCLCHNVCAIVTPVLIYTLFLIWSGSVGFHEDRVAYLISRYNR